MDDVDKVSTEMGGSIFLKCSPRFKGAKVCFFNGVPNIGIW